MNHEQLEEPSDKQLSHINFKLSSSILSTSFSSIVCSCIFVGKEQNRKAYQFNNEETLHGILDFLQKSYKTENLGGLHIKHTLDLIDSTKYCFRHRKRRNIITSRRKVKRVTCQSKISQRLTELLVLGMRDSGAGVGSRDGEPFVCLLCGGMSFIVLTLIPNDEQNETGSSIIKRQIIEKKKDKRKQ
ncbi:hypothetical protein H5410_051978 [Solanum commersonii]|uniref:Uncharacterized protein n=1 Tax=Solanum commersonii TaxID=4109 RepID=A0A9J5X101_SOLCO|nr:hypothetical protein H5410_051978 [Solanum commersonii]